MNEPVKKSKFPFLRMFIILLALAVAGGFIYTLSTKSSHSQTKELYQCPMHPAVISDHPGDCPICGMRLVLIKDEKPNKRTIYKSTMMPGEVSEKPGKDSMGIDMVPVEVDENPKAAGTVSITQQQEQLIGIETTKVTKKDMIRTILAPGKVAHDIELYNAIKEYQLAKASGSQEDSKFKLYHMGLSNDDIEALAKKKDLSGLIYADKSGKSVWIYAQIYESESAMVKKGQDMEIVSLAIPGKIFHSKIDSISSYLDETTRTLRVRGEIKNTDGELKPEMLLDIKIKITLGNKLTIPGEAVMDTGKRKITYVKTGTGTFEPRELNLGFPGDGYYEVLSGVKEGEEVVTSGNFLIDSESKIKAMRR